MRNRKLTLSLIILGFVACTANAARIKDIASLSGNEGEHLIGYGIVVGLGGTGDGSKTGFTNHSVASMMEKFGHTLDPNEIKLKNVAAVMVTANLRPFSRAGGSLDVTVASLGDASSLEGGLLLMTPLLRQADGMEYAIAQGPLSIGGYNIDAGQGNSIRKNHSTVGRIPGGAKLVHDFTGTLIQDNRFELMLHSPDFTTVANIARTINETLGNETAKGLGASRISVWIPSHKVDNTVGFISLVENLKVGTDAPARVVINERTGTVVVGANVRIKSVAIAHGNLRVEISTRLSASQPAAFGAGESLILPQVSAQAGDETGQLAVMATNNTVEEVAGSLNELGVSPRDLIAIFQALKESGALEADLVIM